MTHSDSKRLRAALLASAFLLGTCLLLPAQDRTMDAISGAIRRLFNDHRSAIVQVEGKDSKGVIRGTGFYIDPSGTLYTLASVADGTEEISVIRDGKRFPAKLLTVDSRSGLAILRSHPAEHFLKVSRSPSPSIASPLVMIGFPLEWDASPGFGMVSGYDKKIGDTFFSTTHMRVNLPVLRGQGGSPLLDMHGEVVGIVTSSVDGGTTCYALPIAAAEKIRKDWARFGEPRHGWVGIAVKNTDTPAGGSHAVVDEIDPSAPAGKSGVQNGDVILRVGNTKVSVREDILDASFFLTAGDPAEIEVLRNGERLVLEALPTLHPATKKPPLHAAHPSRSEPPPPSFP